MKVSLRGIFLTSDAPANTAKFYREVARLDLEQVGRDDEYHYWKLDRDGVQLAIHDAKMFAPYTHPSNFESNLTHLYCKVEDRAEFLEHLKKFETIPHSIDDIVITVVDPDGRKVMFGTA